MLKRSLAVVVVAIACACATTEQPKDLEVRSTPVARLTSEEACKKLNASLEASTAATLEIAKARSGAESLTMEIVTTTCRGYAMKAEVAITAIIDGKRQGVITAVELRIDPSGEITGEILGTREAD